ncbi:hypothetical protein MRX96_002339 [Rhipicephalus microplus]
MASPASSSGVKKRRALSLEIKEGIIRDIESDHLQKQGETAAATAARFVFPVTEENTAVRKHRQTKITAFFR